MDPNLMMNRIMRLLKLDVSAFDEVRDDPKELVPAIVIIAASVFLSAIGLTLNLLLTAPEGADLDWGNVFLKTILIGTVVTVALWIGWSAVTALILQSFYKEQADIVTVIRTMGYAAFPFAAAFFTTIGFIGFPIALTGLALAFVLSIFAVQAATGAESDRVIKATAAGFLVMAVILGIFARGSGIGVSPWVNKDVTEATVELEPYKVDLGDFEIPE